MRIQLASDLHLERVHRSFPNYLPIGPAAEAELLVLAGDVSDSCTRVIELFKDWPVPVLYVPGNQESYSLEFEHTRRTVDAACAGTSVRVLDNAVASFDGVRIFGSTLWTDYRLCGNDSQPTSMAYAESSLNRRLLTGQRVFSASAALAEHEQSRRWLKEMLSIPYDGQTVVVSHHAPHPLSVHHRYAGDQLNAAFASDLSELLARADLWLHGHVHDSFDYAVQGCRVVANPLGYLRNPSARQEDFEFENPGFDRACLLDCPARKQFA